MKAVPVCVQQVSDPDESRAHLSHITAADPHNTQANMARRKLEGGTRLSTEG